jgi:hypothetical protein
MAMSGLFAAAQAVVFRWSSTRQASQKSEFEHRARGAAGDDHVIEEQRADP